MIVVCQQCGKEFKTVPARVKDGRGKFCSRKCYELSKRRIETRVCPVCGKTYETTPSDKRQRCSRECFYESRKTLIISKCETCGKEFEHHKARDARFCSVECHIEQQRIEADENKDTRTCPVCGREFRCKPSSPTIHCSLRCASKSRRTAIKVNCAICGDAIKIKPSQFARSKTGQFYCSRECYAEWRKTLVGEKAYPWKGGKSFEPYCRRFNGKFKKGIRKRDGYTCAICKLDGDNVHHIDYDKMNSVPWNCITLCNPCHATTGGNRDYWQGALMGIMRARGHLGAGAARS